MITKTNNILNVKNDIIKTLLYFEVFKYPLTKQELYSYSLFSKKEVDAALQNLIAENLVKKEKGFYTISLTKEQINKRIEGNIRAEKMMLKAKNMSRFIGNFPFVRAVFVSGSLSKGYFEKDDDIDYFIITKNNRLWSARTFLVVFKKIFLLDSKKYFCINYFMSEENLIIAEKNRFTATECVTLKPMFGSNTFQKLIENNTWILDYFPNFKVKTDGEKIKKSFFKYLFERILSGRIGDFLERNFMKITQKHQQRKFKKKLKKYEFDLAFKGDENTSKHHPQNHQIKTIVLLNEKIKAFNKKFGFNIPLEKAHYD